MSPPESGPGAVVVAIVFSIGLFFVVPVTLTSLVKPPARLLARSSGP